MLFGAMKNLILIIFQKHAPNGWFGS